MSLNRYLLLIFHVIKIKFNSLFSSLFTKLLFSTANIKCKKIYASGLPSIHISSNAKVCIGDNFVMGNSILTSATGLKGKCKIDVRNNARLIIGNNVGMTLTSISCFKEIIIEDNVKIGFGTHIMDTDFHAINPMERKSPEDAIHAQKAKILIQENVFIGAHCFILKGVVIGKNSVIAAGSIVTHNIPDNVIAGGNPCKIIRTI